MKSRLPNGHFWVVCDSLILFVAADLNPATKDEIDLGER